MAVTTITTEMVAGVKYTVQTDSSADWSSVSNDVYFYDKATEIVYYKDANGVIINAYAPETSTSQAQILYVDSEFGTDAPTSGDLSSPFLTPEYALTQISNTGTITGNTNTNTTISGISDVDNANLEIGMYLSGTGIPFGTIIVAKGNEGGDANTVTLSKSATATASGLTLTWVKIYELRLSGNFIVTSNLAKDGVNINVQSSTIYWNNFVLFHVLSSYTAPFYVLGNGEYHGSGNSSRFYGEGISNLGGAITSQAYWYAKIEFNQINCAGTLEALKVNQTTITVTRDIVGGFINAHLGKIISCGNGTNNLKFDGYGLTGGFSTTGLNYTTRVNFTGRLETPSAVTVHSCSGIVTGALIGSVSGSPVLHGGWSGSTWNGGGTINGTVGGGTITVSSDMVLNAHSVVGAIVVNSGKTLIFNGYAQTTYLSLTVNDGGTFVNNGYTKNSPWDNYYIDGKFVNYGKIDNSKFYLRATGVLENYGEIVNLISNQGGTVYNHGQWTPAGNNSFHSGGGRIVNRGTMTVSSTNTGLGLSLSGVLENYGEITNLNTTSLNPIINKGIGTLKLFAGSVIRVANGLSPIQIGTVDSGTTTSTTAFKLIQSGQNFLTTVVVGCKVHNTTDNTWATVTNVDSNTQLTLDTDIMVSGETFDIYGNPDVYYFNAVTNCDGTTYGLLKSFDGIAPAPNDLAGGTLFENVNY